MTKEKKALEIDPEVYEKYERAKRHFESKLDKKITDSMFTKVLVSLYELVAKR